MKFQTLVTVTESKFQTIVFFSETLETDIFRRPKAAEGPVGRLEKI